MASACPSDEQRYGLSRVCTLKESAGNLYRQLKPTVSMLRMIPIGMVLNCCTIL